MVYKVTTNLPTTTKISQLNDMLIETDGKTAQGQFDKIELDSLYYELGLTRLYSRDISLGHLTSDYTDWTHLHAESGYSIWKLTKSDYAYNVNNQLFFDDRLMDFRGLAGSETVTIYDTAFTYDGSYVDVTTEMGTEGGTSVTVLEAIGDYLYLGSASTFSGAKLEFFTRGANNTLKVEYHSGSGWKTLTANADLLVDNTSNLASDGSITFTPPVDWDTVAVNSVTKYWIRLSTTTTPVTAAKVYYCIPYNSVIALLAMSSSQINNEEWAWCSYGTAIYVTLRNMGTTYYEGDYYINSSSTAANKLNYFVYNHEIKANYRNTSTDGWSLAVAGAAYAYLPTPTTTTTASASTYYPIEGTFTTDPILNFEVTATPAIKYLGEMTRHFKVVWAAELSSDTTATTVHLGMKVNGTLVPSSPMGQYLKTSGEVAVVCGLCVVELDTDDELQLVISSDKPGAVLNMHHYTTSIEQFG